MKKSIITLLLFSLTINTYSVDLLTSLESSAMAIKGHPGENWLLLGLSDVKIGISQRTGKIRFEVTPRLQSVGTDVSLSLYRGFVRASLSPNLRITVGKAPISWGVGNYYNAGDLFYSSSALAQGSNTSLRDDVLRDNARPLINLYFPLGQYGYIEAIAATPDVGAIAIGANNLQQNPLSNFSYTNSAVGSRFGYKFGDIEMQLGALYLGEEDSMRGFISLGGGIASLIDWKIATRTAFHPKNPLGDDAAKSWELTVGLSLPYTFENGQFLAVGVESIFRPFKSWSPINAWPINNLTNQPIYSYEDYGNELYFELTYRPISIVTLLSRVVYLPIDQSAQLFTMLVYSPIQGFSLFLQNSVELGSLPSSLNTRKAGSIFVAFGAKYVI